MNHRLTCYTLFDITQTGVLNRAKPATNIDYDDWVYKRNTQCNFDTILQAISLRAQPEVVKKPKKIDIDFLKTGFFGANYTSKNLVPCWTFDFEIYHSSVFDDNINELGHLISDCHGIPMIKCTTQFQGTASFLDTSFEQKNIYFVKYNYE